VHFGFNTAADHVYDALIANLKKMTVSKDTRVLITGHSRGAAVANIVAARLTKDNNYKDLTEKNVYGYTFATPNVDTNADTKMKNIHNFVNADDFVPRMPLRDWGYKKNGQVYVLSRHSNSLTSAADKTFKNITGDNSFHAFKIDDIDSLVKNLKGMADKPKDYYSPKHLVYTVKKTNIKFEATVYEYMMNGVAAAKSGDKGKYLDALKIKMNDNGVTFLLNSGGNVLTTADKYKDVSKFFSDKGNDVFKYHINDNHLMPVYIAWLTAYGDKTPPLDTDNKY
jgi:hypothetical protein